MSKQQASDCKHTFDALPVHLSRTLQSYRVELPHDLLDEQGQLLEWVIGYAFDTLDARHLDLRIVAAAHTASAMP